MKVYKVKKIIQSIVALLVCTNFLTAQSPFRVGAGFNVVFPTGDYTQIAETGTGGSLLIDYSFSPKIAMSLSSSFTTQVSKMPQTGVDSKTIDFDIKSIDLLLGGRYYFIPSFFGLVESGVRYIQLHANIYDATTNSNDEASSDYEPHFTLGTGVGYKYNLAEGKSDFELSALYHYVSGDVIDFPTFTLRASIMIYL